ncbi:hypothetical protein MBLNU13_g04531t2 [Cladosporium sp. NU13]
MPIESPYPPITVPEVDVWTYYLERPDREYPDGHVLFVDVATGKKLTFNQIRTAGEHFGKGLQEKWRWRKGDVLATVSPNTIDLVPATFGALRVGGVICPLNFLYTVDELVSQLKPSKAKGLITNVACLHVVREAASRVGLPLDRILLVGDADPKIAVPHFTSLRGSSRTVENVAINPKEDLAYLVYSSGTTGLPKGVMLTHNNIVANSIQIASAEGPDITHWRKDRSLGFLPMYHIYGVAVLMLSPLHRGVTTYIMRAFNLPEFCRVIEQEAITVAYIVPPVALALAKAPVVSKFNLSSLRFMHSSAAPTSTEIIVAVNDRLRVPIRQGYGLSEAAPGVSSQRSSAWNVPIGASGRLVPSMSAKFALENGKEAAPGSEGEIRLKGPNIFKGYYNNLEATANSFDSEGWYHTGDVGRADDQGNIYITDRLKDLIKYNGFQVAPAQLEDLLLGHAAVADVAVIGVYSEKRATELPRAYVVVADGHKGNKKLAETLQHWLNERVSPHKKLRGGVRFVDAIPKSNAGKILRRVLLEQARSEEKKLDSSLKARL